MRGAARLSRAKKRRAGVPLRQRVARKSGHRTQTDSVRRKQGAGIESGHAAHAFDAGVHVFSEQRRLCRRHARRFAARTPAEIRAKRKKFQSAREEIEMSAWRKQALEMLPEYRQQIEESETPMTLWVELWCRFSFDYKKHGNDLIGRFYKYAKWCLDSPNEGKYRSDAGTAAWCAFYEHLTDGKEIQADVHKWLSKEDFLKLEGAFRYHLEQKEYDEFKADFLERREKFIQQIPKSKK